VVRLARPVRAQTKSDAPRRPNRVRYRAATLRPHAACRLLRLADPPIDGRNLVDPTPAISVLEIEDRVRRPVEVIGNEGYLLEERVKGVA